MPSASGTSKSHFSLLLRNSGGAAEHTLPNPSPLVLTLATEVPSYVLRNYQIHLAPDQSPARIRRLREKTRRTPPRRTRINAPTRKSRRPPPRTSPRRRHPRLHIRRRPRRSGRRRWSNPHSPPERTLLRPRPPADRLSPH